MAGYSCYRDLSLSEKEGVDFDVVLCDQPEAAAVVVALHGGGIEPKTGEIAREIAGKEFSFYCFRGLKTRGNFDLHITSSKFDEPRCLALVKKHRWVVTIHGCDKEGEQVYLGGLDEALIQEMASALTAVGIRAKRPRQEYSGARPTNICNRGLTGAGVQFELSRSFRRGEHLPAFIDAVRGVLARKQKSEPVSTQ
jgi:phage replication-related protein YjqB (UPF0714/DUF867 family)